MPALAAALDDADGCLAVAPVALARPDDDPLAVRLPPLPPDAAFDPRGVRALAALYLHSQLEQAGLLPAVEMLAEARDQLAVRTTAAAKLEEFARGMPAQYDLPSRNRIFARLFGTGRAVLAGDGTPVNREFEHRLAGLCFAARQVEGEYRWATAPSAAAEVGVRQSATLLLANLSARPFAGTELAAARVQRQTRLAVDVLADPEVGRLVGGRGVWDTLGKLLGAELPDVGRFVARGQSGMRVLDWMGGRLPDLRSGGGPPLAPPGSPLFGWAAEWLRATGLES